MGTSASRFQFHELHKLKEPGKFFAGGLAAGAFIFLLWMFSLPDSKDEAPEAGPAAVAAKAHQGIGGDGDGVLGDITGGIEPGAARIVPPPAVATVQEETDLSASNDQATAPSDEQSIAEGMLPGAAAAALQRYHVEVERGPELTELLEINARSPQHAAEIIRDFRGNPPVLRGPSLRPLD